MKKTERIAQSHLSNKCEDASSTCARTHSQQALFSLNLSDSCLCPLAVGPEGFAVEVA